VAAPVVEGRVAPKPLYRDPVHDGAADPTLIWNRAKGEWWMFYTNRRADLATVDPRNVAWVHQTRIGIAVSRDQGATWTYRGTANIPYGTAEYTHWAPDIVYSGGWYHMFLTIVPGTFENWNAPREIIHLSSADLVAWKFVGKLELGSDRVIDPSLAQLPDGTWRLWYKDERDHSHIHYAESKDLNAWTAMGAAITDRSSEGPKIFHWHGQYWMIVDAGRGLAVYQSPDALDWKPQAEFLLQAPGHAATDRGFGHHCDVVVNGDRAFLFYFTHLQGADEIPDLPHSAQRSVLQVGELIWADGKLTVDRDKATHVLLGGAR
jgi:sucrose-6-phosphate hydrolase SacC (GH32 family)